MLTGKLLKTLSGASSSGVTSKKTAFQPFCRSICCERIVPPHKGTPPKICTTKNALHNKGWRDLRRVVMASIDFVSPIGAGVGLDNKRPGKRVHRNFLNR